MTKQQLYYYIPLDGLVKVHNNGAEHCRISLLGESTRKVVKKVETDGNVYVRQSI